MAAILGKAKPPNTVFLAQLVCITSYIIFFPLIYYTADTAKMLFFLNQVFTLYIIKSQFRDLLQSETWFFC